MVQDGAVAHVAPRRQRVLRDARRRRSESARTKTITVYYHGKPTRGASVRRGTAASSGAATASATAGSRPPTRDSARASGGRTRTSQADEPDSQRIAITVPDSMIDVSNGRLRSTTHNADGTTTYEWFVTSPINNYDVEVNAGQLRALQRHVSTARSGKLTLDFWPLAYHVDTAKMQFAAGEADARSASSTGSARIRGTRTATSSIEAPHLGMEHQSAVAYGNHLQERLPRPRSLGHRAGAQVGLHHRPRERARVVGQQHHDEGSRRHVGARELRELRRGALHRVPGWQGGGRASTSSAAARNIKNDAPIIAHVRRERTKARATCTTRAATCCT